MANAGSFMRGGTVAALYGGLPEDLEEAPKDFFSLAVEWRPIALGSSVVKQAIVGNDASFLIIGFNGTVFDAAAITQPTTRPLRVRIEDSGSGRQFSNIAVAWDSLVGTGQLPGFLPYPKIIPRASTIQVTLTNDAPATAYDVSLVMVGFKVYG